MARTRLLMDAHLLDALAAAATRRIVYVADASAYGATGPRPITEDEPPRPSARGRCLFRADAVFSNIRLRGTGFHFTYPTLEEGLRQVLGTLHE